MEPTDDSQAAIEKTGDLVKEGVTRIAVSALGRLEEAITAVRQGKFDDAHTRTSEAMGKLVLLATVERQIGTMGMSFPIRASEVHGGMDMGGSWGVVESVDMKHSDGESCDDCGEAHDAVVVIKLEDGREKVMHPEQEVLIFSGDNDGQ